MKYVGIELPLVSPLTALSCDEFKKMGFFISGVVPHSPTGDALVLQRLQNACVDFDDVRVTSGVLVEIKSYVMSHAPSGGTVRKSLR